MSVVVLVSDDKEAPPLVRWAAHFARALDRDLQILNVVRKPNVDRVEDIPLNAVNDGSAVLQAVRAVSSDLHGFVHIAPPEPDPDSDAAGEPPEPDPPQRRVLMRQVQSGNPVAAVLRELVTQKAQLLMIPRHAKLRHDDEQATERQLFLRAPCDTMLIRIGHTTGERCRRILTPAAGGVHSIAALKLAYRVCQQESGELTALYVQPNLGDDATLVGERVITRIVTRALGPETRNVTSLVTLANNTLDGISKACSPEDDLVLIGTSHHGPVHRMLFSTVPERMLASDSGSAVAVVRAAVPLRSRFQQAVERRLRNVVPQLDRGRRVELTERIQSSSQFNFDFVALMCLSTLIAALGLVANSTAVIIGAMLVAPLMTPLLGAGLALVQGNALLLKMAVRTVGQGFLVSVLIGCAVALTPMMQVSSEMTSRTSPAVTDLIIALASGLAAAYAIGRPNLLSALPGVAIAAALVPPVATCGLFLASGDLGRAGGAATLFFVNIVAIVLGTAVSFWSVGIRRPHKHGRGGRWSWIGTTVLLVIAVVLAIVLSEPENNKKIESTEETSRVYPRDDVHFDRLA